MYEQKNHDVYFSNRAKKKIAIFLGKKAHNLLSLYGGIYVKISAASWIMKSAFITENSSQFDPQTYRRVLQHQRTPELKRRRGIIGFSLLGMLAMSAVTLLQTGLIKHLPDPPRGNF